MIKHAPEDVALLEDLGSIPGSIEYDRDLQRVARFRDKAEHSGLEAIEKTIFSAQQAVDDANKRVTSNASNRHEMSWALYIAAFISRPNSLIDSEGLAWAYGAADRILEEQKKRFK